MTFREFFERMPQMRFLHLALLYGVIVLARAWWMGDPPADQYLLTRDLQHNHRLVAEDLTRPSSGAGSFGWRMPDKATLVGKYLAPQERWVHQQVGERHLVAEPDLSIPPGRKAFLFPLTGTDWPSRTLDVGWTVILVDTTKPEATTPPTPPAGPAKVYEATVVAIVCAATTCSAIVSLPTDDEAALRNRSLALRMIERGQSRW